MPSSSKTPPFTPSSETLLPPDDDTEGFAGEPTNPFADADDPSSDAEITETEAMAASAAVLGSEVDERAPTGSLPMLAVLAFAVGFGVVMMSVFQGQFLVSAYHHGGL